MDHLRFVVSVASAFIMTILMSSCAPAPAGSGQQAISQPTETLVPLLAQVPVASTTPVTAGQLLTVSGSPTPDATVFEEAAHSASIMASPTPVVMAQKAEAIAATATVSPQVVSASLQDEIFLAGAPLFAIMFMCDLPPAEIDSPAVTWQQAEGIGQLCLYGFDEGEEVQYEVYDSAGVEVDARIARPSTLDGPRPAAAVVLEVESYAPGRWGVTASSPSASVQTIFEVAAREGPPLIAMRLLPGEEATQESRGLTGLQGGDDVLITAVHLPAETDIPVGVYYAAEDDYAGSTLTLHEQATLPTDETGVLSIRLQLDPSYLPGFYCVVIAATEDYVPERGSGERGATECFTIASE